MIKGMKKLEEQLKEIAEADYVPALERGVREAILPEMQRLTPVDTGDLLASEEVVVRDNTVSLLAGTDHAIFVEFGTSRMSAQPYMRPAIDTKSHDAMKIAADGINKEMEKVAK